LSAKELLTVEQAAAEFEIHRTTLFRAIADGRLPRHRWVGDRRTYVDRRDVARLMVPPGVARCLQLVYEDFDRAGEWPKVSDLQRRITRQGEELDLALILDGFPRELGWRVRDREGRAELTLKGIAQCEGSGELLAAFSNLVRACYERYIGDDDSLQVTSAEMAARFGLDRLILDKLYRLVQTEGAWWRALGRTGDAWSIDIDDRIRYFRDVRSISDYFAAKQTLIEAYRTPPTSAQFVPVVPTAAAAAPETTLHPVIATAVGELLQTGNGTSAVVAAAAAFERLLKSQLSEGKKYGTRLVAAYFDRAARAGIDDARRVEALQMIATGAYRAFRNEAAHGQRDFMQDHAREVVALFSLLAREVDALDLASEAIGEAEATHDR
jgi:excisionase family DNA binding protein